MPHLFLHLSKLCLMKSLLFYFIQYRKRDVIFLVPFSAEMSWTRLAIELNSDLKDVFTQRTVWTKKQYNCNHVCFFLYVCIHSVDPVAICCSLRPPAIYSPFLFFLPIAQTRLYLPLCSLKTIKEKRCVLFSH